MAFIAAVCPQCSGNLQVPDDRDVVKCMYCGVDVVIRQAIRLVSGNTSNLLLLGDAAREAGNHAEAIDFYNRVLENDPKNASAWFGKGVSAGWSSTLASFRFQEMLVSCENAVKWSNGPDNDAMRKQVSLAINEVAIACYGMSRKHMLEFVALPATWGEYLPRCQEIVSALRVALAYEPKNPTLLENVIHLCKDNIEGVAYNDPYDNNIRKVVYLSDAYEAELRALMERCADDLKEIRPDYSMPEAKRPSAGCFVVTATFGDPNHPNVRLLRAFRDTALESNRAGRVLCRIYYRYGPACANWIKDSPRLRAASRQLLVAPGVLAATAYFRWLRRP